MHDDGAAGRPTAPLHRRREVVATGQAGSSRQQRRRVPRTEEFRPTIRCDPCGAAQPRWRARHGSASATGTRESSRGDGCSAGTYACPCSRLSFSRCSVLIGPGSRCRVAAVGDCGRSVIPCRHRRHFFKRVPHGAQPERVVARAHKNTRRWAGDLASLGGRDRCRQNARLASLRSRHAVTSVMLAIPGFLWQRQTLLNVPALAAPEDRRRTVHGLIRRGFEECADRCC